MESLPWTLRTRDPGRIRFRVRSSRTGDTSRRLCLQGVPEVTSLSLIHYSKIRLSVSRCSLYFLHFLRRITHTTSFHPPFLITSMPENRTDHQLDGSFQVSEARMPAEFGLAMAIFVVVASMVGVGVLTTSGYTMAMVGSNEYMLALWVVGGVIAACGALTLAELSAALPHTGGDYVYLQRPKTGLEPSRVVLYPFVQHSVRHGDPLERYGGRHDAPSLVSRHRLQTLGT